MEPPSSVAQHHTTPGAAAYQAERESHLRAALGDELLDSVHKARLLVVGAGGIGCELLKNLVLSGFKNIEVIDLDTIDLSNLNRQFLFHKQHIGQPKAIVARESALCFNPSANIVAIHGNVKDERYGPDYIRNFDLVLNALDNLAARRHVNRLCLATGVPLIESGTAGYLGQVSVHLKGVSECYECQPKPAPRTFATCTIRNNPTDVIHCIVWAKYLFARLFGRKDDQNSVTELEEDEAAVAKKDPMQDSVLEAEQAALLAVKSRGFAEWIFHKVFHTDIVRLSRMTDQWKGKTPPSPLPVNGLSKYAAGTPLPSEGNASNGQQLSEQRVWSLEENIWHFFNSVAELRSRASSQGELEWNKDDLPSLTFVTATANLRAFIFHLPLSSRFQVKSAAGNIIPAIATTNAVIAGLIVMQAYKLLARKPETCSNVFLLKQPSSGRILLRSRLEKPNPGCYVCGSHFLTLRIDTNKETLGFLIAKVLVQHLGFAAPNIDAGGTFIEGGDEGLDDEEKEAQKKLQTKNLSHLSITHNKVIVVTDQLQDMEVQVSIQHAERETLGEEQFKIEGKTDNLSVNANMRQPAAAAAAVPGKRKRSDGTPLPASTDKRPRPEIVLVVDDDE